MSRRTAFALAAVLVLTNGCGDGADIPPRPSSEEKLTRFTFSIDGKPYAISLPEQAAMRDQHEPRSATFDARKNQRQMKLMIISATSRHPNVELNDTRRLSNGATIRYRDLGEVGGGSGGTEFEIAGRIDIGPSVLFITCTDQTQSVGAPGWCLDYLHTLEAPEQTR